MKIYLTEFLDTGRHCGIQGRNVQVHVNLEKAALSFYPVGTDLADISFPKFLDGSAPIENASCETIGWITEKSI